MCMQCILWHNDSRSAEINSTLHCLAGRQIHLYSGMNKPFDGRLFSLSMRHIPEPVQAMLETNPGRSSCILPY